MTEPLPIAVDKAKVGTYPALTASGGGHFFDDVLEYRVWVCPPEGGDDYYLPFATYEEALAYRVGEPGADEPIVLVRQLEWVIEESPGYFVRKTGERLAEWRVEWLSDRKRLPGCVDKFLAQRIH